MADARLNVDGTLDDCIRQFMTKPAEPASFVRDSHRSAATVVSVVLSVEQIIELARLREFYRDKNARGSKMGNGRSCSPTWPVYYPDERQLRHRPEDFGMATFWPGPEPNLIFQIETRSKRAIVNSGLVAIMRPRNNHDQLFRDYRNFRILADNRLASLPKMPSAAAFGWGIKK